MELWSMNQFKQENVREIHLKSFKSFKSTQKQNY